MELRSVLTPAIDCMLTMSYDFWMMEPIVLPAFVTLYKWFFTFLKWFSYLISVFRNKVYCFLFIMIFEFTFDSTFRCIEFLKSFIGQEDVIAVSAITKRNCCRINLNSVVFIWVLITTQWTT